MDRLSGERERGLRLLRDSHAYAAPSDTQLCRRAAAGDEGAFEALLGRHRRKLRNVAASFVGYDTALDDLEQIAVLKLWREVRCGAFNPARGGFAAFASTVAHQALRDDRQRRRAQRRWAPEPPISLNLDRADDDLDPWISPSWWNGADPLQIVLQREALRLAWEELSEANQANLNRWLAADGGNRPTGLTKSEITCAAAARSRGRAVLDQLV